MTMSLGKVAKSHAYQPTTTTTARPLSQPAIGEENRAPDSSEDRHAEEKASWSRVSATSSESTNCRYETSSEGPPVKIQPPNSINVDPSEVDHADDPWSIVQSKEDVAWGFNEIGSFSRTMERSESLPALLVNRPERLRSQGHITQVLLTSESSHARIAKFRRIVASVESSGWSIGPSSLETLSGENKSGESVSPYRGKKIAGAGGVVAGAGTDKPRAAVRNAFELFNKPKGITFLTTKEEEKEEEEGEEQRGLESENRGRSRKGFHNCNWVELPIGSCAGGLCDDLVNIGKNPHPSIKSIYFPPSLEESDLSQGLGTVETELRSARRLAGNRSGVEALSRIENELGPLQNKFNELAGKVRALRIIDAPCGLRVDSWFQSSARSTVSHDPSGYFLHRAEAFCRNDSLFNGFSGLELSALSTANCNAFLETGCESRRREIATSFHRLNCADRAITEDRQRVYDEVRIVRDKPVDRGAPSDSCRMDNRSEKRIDSSSRDDRREWDRWRSTLPTEKSARSVESPIASADFVSDGHLESVENRGSAVNSNDVTDRQRPSDRSNEPVDRKESCTRRISRKISESSATAQFSSNRSSESAEHAPRSVKNRQCGEDKTHCRHCSHRKSSHKHHRLTSSKARREKSQSCQTREDRIGKSIEEGVASSRKIVSRDVAVGREDIDLQVPAARSPNSSRARNVSTTTRRANSPRVSHQSSRDPRIRSSSLGQQLEDSRRKLTSDHGAPLTTTGDSALDLRESLGSELGETLQLPPNSLLQEQSTRKPRRLERDSRKADRLDDTPRLPNADEAAEERVSKTSSRKGKREKEMANCEVADPRRSRGRRGRSRRTEREGTLARRSPGGHGEGSSSEYHRENFSRGATNSFASRMTQVAEEHTFVESREESWFGQWRTGSRLSVAYNVEGSSRTSICSSSASTINTERTVRIGRTSRITISNRTEARTGDLSPNGSRPRRRTPEALSSGRRGGARPNQFVTGVRTSPEDFLDDA